MKNIVFLFACMLSSYSWAQSINLIGSTTSYGNLGYQQANVLRWDGLSGNITSNISTGYNTYLLGAKCFDASSGNYYIRLTEYQNMQSEYIKYNTTNNSITPLSNTTYMTTGAEVDMSNGKMYNLTTTDSNYIFTEYTPSTNTFSVLVTLPINTFDAINMQSTCFNSNSHVFHFLASVSGVTELFSLNVNTASSNSLQHLPLLNQNVTIATDLQFDNNTNTLYGITTQFGGLFSEPTLMQIDANTGNSNLITSLSNYIMYQMGSATYSQATGDMVFMAMNSQQIMEIIKYNFASNSSTILPLPININPYELHNLECDNTAFAQQKYKSTTSINTLKGNNTIALWPNPSSNIIYIGELANNIYLINNTGQVISQASNTNSINTSNLPRGNYVLKAIVGNKVYNQAVVLN
jgi:hypothetical protein